MKREWYDVRIIFRKRLAGETSLPIDKLVLTDSLYEGESEETAKNIFADITETKNSPLDKFRGLLCSAEYGDIEIIGNQAGVLWTMALVNGNKKLVTERLKWWKNNLQYKAPEQLRDCLNSMFKEFLG